MTTQEKIDALRYLEAVELPKFKESLDRVLNKTAFNFLLSTHSVTTEELPLFIEKAIREGNAVLIEREFCGSLVTLWRD